MPIPHMKEQEFKALMGLVATHVLTQIHQDHESHRSDQDQAPLESGLEAEPQRMVEDSTRPPRLQGLDLYRLAHRIRTFWTAFWTNDQP